MPGVAALARARPGAARARSRSGGSTHLHASAVRSTAATPEPDWTRGRLNDLRFGPPLRVVAGDHLVAVDPRPRRDPHHHARGAPAAAPPPAGRRRARPVVPRPPRWARPRPRRGARRSTTSRRSAVLADLGSSAPAGRLGWRRGEQPSEAAAGRGVRRDPARRPDPALPALAAHHARRAVDAARRRARPRRGPARRRDPRGPRGDRPRRRGGRHRPRLLRPPAGRLARAAGGSTRTPSGSCTTGGCRWTPRSRGCWRWTGRRSRRAWQPVADVLDGDRAGHADGGWRRWPTTGRSGCSGSRRTP